MKSGYRIVWTAFASKELEQTITYLRENWTEKELKQLARAIEHYLGLIEKNPYIFQASESMHDIRRVVILKYNSLYYRVKENEIEIISFFSNRQNPNKRLVK